MAGWQALKKGEKWRKSAIIVSNGQSVYVMVSPLTRPYKPHDPRRLSEDELVKSNPNPGNFSLAAYRSHSTKTRPLQPEGILSQVEFGGNSQKRNCHHVV